MFIFIWVFVIITMVALGNSLRFAECALYCACDCERPCATVSNIKINTFSIQFFVCLFINRHTTDEWFGGVRSLSISCVRHFQSHCSSVPLNILWTLLLYANRSYGSTIENTDFNGVRWLRVNFDFFPAFTFLIILTVELKYTVLKWKFSITHELCMFAWQPKWM